MSFRYICVNCGTLYDRATMLAPDELACCDRCLTRVVEVPRPKEEPPKPEPEEDSP